jgi:hypothetical protein
MSQVKLYSVLLKLCSRIYIIQGWNGPFNWFALQQNRKKLIFVIYSSADWPWQLCSWRVIQKPKLLIRFRLANPGLSHLRLSLVYYIGLLKFPLILSDEALWFCAWRCHILCAVYGWMRGPGSPGQGWPDSGRCHAGTCSACCPRGRETAIILVSFYGIYNKKKIENSKWKNISEFGKWSTVDRTCDMSPLTPQDTVHW